MNCTFGTVIQTTERIGSVERSINTLDLPPPLIGQQVAVYYWCQQIAVYHWSASSCLLSISQYMYVAGDYWLAINLCIICQQVAVYYWSESSCLFLVSKYLSIIGQQVTVHSWSANRYISLVSKQLFIIDQPVHVCSFLRF